MFSSRICTGVIASLCFLSHVSAAPQPIVSGEDALGLVSLMQRSADPLPLCNVAAAKIPDAPTPLPPPSSGLTLQHVFIGRGTQNYTCANSTAQAIPVATGALALLFNASCIAAPFPALLALMPGIAQKLPMPAYPNTASNSKTASSTSQMLVGHHFFSDNTTPVFDLNTAVEDGGVVACKKLNATNAPDAVRDVPWLKLGAKSDDGCTVQEVYRVNTVGGQPPKTCDGQQSVLTVQYAAEYWFYSQL